MIKPIGPQYIAAKANQRVGLTHVSSVIDRLMRIYGLEDELIEQQELAAAEKATEEFASEPIAIVPEVAVPAGTQSSFAWFE
jgi:hypothetical protein